MPSKKKINNKKNSKKFLFQKEKKEIRLIGIDVDKVKKILIKNGNCTISATKKIDENLLF